jgi:hypothetical protein
MPITTETIQTTIGALNSQFAGREGDIDYKATNLVHIHRRQRPYVWNQEMQSILLDSIITGYYIPPIISSSVYEHCCCDNKIREKREVLDGGNRITTFRRILNGYIRELTDAERTTILSFPITFVVMRGMTNKEQCTMFRRLNKNIKVSDGQLYAMSDDSLLVKEALALLNDENYPLRRLILEHFDPPGSDNNGRKNLENAVALVSGALNGPHYITKSYNIQEEKVESQEPIDRNIIIDILSTVFHIFTLANQVLPLTDRRKLKSQWSVGKWLGAMLYDILTHPNEIEETQNRWAKYIIAVRRGDMFSEDASKLSGGQNLTANKYRRICAKVAIFINQGRLAIDSEIMHLIHDDDDITVTTNEYIEEDEEDGELEEEQI